MGRRQQILDAASAIVSEHGIVALSVRGVAARAGIGASTLRHYFPSQRDLYDAVVGQAFHAQLDDMRITDRAVPPSRRLIECAAQFLPRDGTRSAELEGWFALYASGVGPERTEQGSRLLATLTRHARNRVEQWLATLQEEEALKGGEIARHATLLLTMVDGLSLGILTPDSGVTVPGARELLGAVIIGAIVRDGR